MARKKTDSGEDPDARKVKQRGTRRDLDALRERRMRAAEMFAAGRRQIDVAVELEVSQQTASRWFRQWTGGGGEALEGAGRAGRRPRLDDAQIEVIREELLQGPQAHGFATGVWALGRVAIVIERLTGAHYGPTQTWTILRTRLGWSRQRPARRAVERDEDAVVAWRENEWPRIKKIARRRGAWICFQDESGVSLLPVVRATWAPKGVTPVLHHRFSWKRMSMARVLAYRPDRSRTAFVFSMTDGSYNTDKLIEFLVELRTHFAGEKLIVIWDGLMAHRSRAMAAWLATQRDWLHVERLPGYAPELGSHRTGVGQHEIH